MTNKFKVSNLPKCNEVKKEDQIVIEHDSASKKLNLDTLSKSLLSAHLDVSVGRYTAKGNNVLSVNHKDDNGNLTNVLTAQLQDGILSAAKYSDQTKELSLFFNTTNPANAMISVSLSGLADTYTAGEGLTLTDSRFALSAASSDSIGGVKLGYSENGKNYALQVDDSTGKAFVYVPWTGGEPPSGDGTLSCDQLCTIYAISQSAGNITGISASNKLSVDLYTLRSNLTSLQQTVNGLTATVNALTAALNGKNIIITENSY